MFRIDDRDVGVGLDVGGSNDPRFAGLDQQGDRLALGRYDQDLLQVENDIRDILNDVVDGLEFVVNARDLNRRDGGTFDGTEEDAAKRIADRMSITGLEGLGDKLGVGRRSAVFNFGELAGQFELSEAFGHGWEF